MKKVAIRMISLFLLLLLLLAPAAGARAEVRKLPQVMQLHQVSVFSTMSYVLMTEDCTILIDSGLSRTKDDYTTVQPILTDTYLSALGFDHIDAHIVTHWHNDHSFNIQYFNEKYGNEQTVLYGVSAVKPERFVITHGRYQQLKENDELDIGPFHIKVIGPTRPRLTGEFNDHSLNFIVTYGNRRILFTGDSLNYDTRQRHAGEIANIDVFQFPHHGLQKWMIDAYSLKVINPKLVLVPGHGTAYLMQYMKNSGVTTTPDIFDYDDTQGHATVLLCDGDKIMVLRDQAPGMVTRWQYPHELVSNTTAD